MLGLRFVQEARVRADAAVWNALIATAGRAGQLQRAFQALEDMQVCYPLHTKCFLHRGMQICP